MVNDSTELIAPEPTVHSTWPLTFSSEPSDLLAFAISCTDSPGAIAEGATSLRPTIVNGPAGATGGDGLVGPLLQETRPRTSAAAAVSVAAV